MFQLKQFRKDSNPVTFEMFKKILMDCSNIDLLIFYKISSDFFKLNNQSLFQSNLKKCKAMIFSLAYEKNGSILPPCEVNSYAVKAGFKQSLINFQSKVVDFGLEDIYAWTRI